MCKLFAVVEIENQKNAEIFTKKAIPEITATDNHGLGIMRLGERGVHIQRWLEPPTVVRKNQSPMMRRYEKALKHQQNEAGQRSQNLYAIAVHGRFATCARTMENVHPFYKDGTALMHNGIIHEPEQYTRTLSTCDSEALLSQYVENGVRTHAGKLSAALDGVGGYYGAIVFNDGGTIDIFRDDYATLFLAHVRGVGVVIATTEEIITKTAKRCKAYLTGIDEVLPFTNIRWRDGVSPQISTFHPRKPVMPFMPTVVSPNGHAGTHSNLAPDILAGHQANTSDASGNWWNTEEWDDEDKEAKNVMAWQKEQEADKKAMERLQVGAYKAAAI